MGLDLILGWLVVISCRDPGLEGWGFVCLLSSEMRIDEDDKSGGVAYEVR